MYQSTKIRTGPLYYSIVGTVITNQGTEIRTGPLYHSIVGTVITYQGTEIGTGPLYYSIVGTVRIKIPDILVTWDELSFDESL